MGRDKFTTGLNFEETMKAIIDYKPKKEEDKKEKPSKKDPEGKPLSGVMTLEQMEKILGKSKDQKDS